MKDNATLNNTILTVRREQMNKEATEDFIVFILEEIQSHSSIELYELSFDFYDESFRNKDERNKYNFKGYFNKNIAELIKKVFESHGYDIYIDVFNNSYYRAGWIHVSWRKGLNAPF